MQGLKSGKYWDVLFEQSYSVLRHLIAMSDTKVKFERHDT